MGTIDNPRPRGWVDGWPLSNVWLGTSVEDQKRADERIPHLLRCPARVRFLSCEPLVAPIDLTRIDYADPPGSMRMVGQPKPHLDCLRGYSHNGRHAQIDWVIVGGESGPTARPCDVEWIRSIVAHCRAARVACFIKQLGAFPVEYREVGTSKGGAHAPMDLRDRKGGDMAEWPADLRVREWPKRTAETLSTRS
jgi:protein gp37